MKTILIVSTLDTKYEETRILENYINEQGCRTEILDCSLRSGGKAAGTLRREMFVDTETDEKQLDLCSKNDALIQMTELVKKQITVMYNDKRLDGVIGIGGVQGSLISAGAMQTLPVGVPKMLVSAVANGNTAFGPLVGMSDMTIMHSVVDIAGTNRILKKVMRNAAAAISGMANCPPQKEKSPKMVGLTMGGVTTQCGNYIKDILRKKGLDVIIFHCNGIGAMAMENLAEEGELSAVIDLTPHDVTDYLYGGIMPASRHRYQGLSRSGIPVVIVPGCADIILFNGIENVPRDMKGRKFVEHNKLHTHVKADYQEMYGLGKFIAERTSQSMGEVKVLVPEQGLSQKNCPGGPLYEPEADRGFLEAVAEYKAANTSVEAVPLHINDYAFAKICVEELMEMLMRCAKKGGE